MSLIIFRELYLIEILHQTTTHECYDLRFVKLYLIEILHQTTTEFFDMASLRGCILSKFYIKPQQCTYPGSNAGVVSYRNSTSNHNGEPRRSTPRALYLIEILHQTTTPLLRCSPPLRCILSKFYIKPQLVARNERKEHGCILSKFYIKPQPRVSPQNSTRSCILSKFYIKPQHCPGWYSLLDGCILSKFYIKPQHCPGWYSLLDGCILSKFYIKPQLGAFWVKRVKSCILSKFYIKPQQRQWSSWTTGRCILSKFYIKPQLSLPTMALQVVVSYRNSTSNHNGGNRYSDWLELYLIEILHQTTTSGLILIDKVLLTGCLPL